MRRVLLHPPIVARVVLAGWLAGGPLAGCGALRPLGTTSDTGVLEGDADADADADADTDTDVVATGDVPITGIDPPWGSNLGGSLVTVAGGPFTGDARVYFNGVESPFLAAVSAESIVATVPTTGAVGPVDVRVDSGGLSGTVPGGFEYWEDASGNYGMYGELGWYVTRGEYWDPAPPPPFFFGNAYFAEPSPDPYWKVYYSTSMDSCATNHPDTSVRLDVGATTLDFTSGTDTITLLQDVDDPLWFAAGSDTVATADVTLGGTYALDPIGGGWPQFTLVNAATIPSNDPDLTTPVIDGAAAPAQLEDSFNLVWGTPYDADYVLIDLLRTRPDVPGFIERVSCVAMDDGAFKIPSGSFSSWDPGKGDTIYVYIGRAVEAGGTLPYNNAKSGVVGVNWELGVVFAR